MSHHATLINNESTLNPIPNYNATTTSNHGGGATPVSSAAGALAGVSLTGYGKRGAPTKAEKAARRALLEAATTREQASKGNPFVSSGSTHAAASGGAKQQNGYEEDIDMNDGTGAGGADELDVSDNEGAAGGAGAIGPLPDVSEASHMSATMPDRPVKLHRKVRAVATERESAALTSLYRQYVNAEATLTRWAMTIQDKVRGIKKANTALLALGISEANLYKASTWTNRTKAHLANYSMRAKLRDEAKALKAEFTTKKAELTKIGEHIEALHKELTERYGMFVSARTGMEVDDDEFMDEDAAEYDL